MRKKKVLSKFRILCWAVFVATLGHVRLADRGLDAPGSVLSILNGAPLLL